MNRLSLTALILVLNIYLINAATITSSQSGSWSSSSTWVGGVVPVSSDNVIIASGHSVTLTANTTITDLTISQSSVFNDGNKTMTVTGNFTIDGTYTGQKDLTLSGSGTTIAGYGDIMNTGKLILTGNKTINSAAIISKSGSPLQLSVNTTVTNNGRILVEDALDGTNSTSIWVNNGSSAKLSLGKNITAILNATSTGNTVEYYNDNTAMETVIQPVSNTYYHLMISGQAEKRLAGDITIEGNLVMTNGNFNAFTNTINIRGNFQNTGAFDEWTSTFIFDGTADQYISNSLGETFYNVTANKASGGLILSNSVIVINTLTMTSGNIVTGTNKITIGTSTGITGALSRTGGTIVGNCERWISTTGTAITFPVGTSSDYRPAVLTITNLTSGSLIVSFVSTAPGNNGLPTVDGLVPLYNTYNDGYWTLSAQNSLASNNYTIECTGTNFVGFSNIANAHLVLRNSSSSAWTASSGTYSPVVGSTAKRTGCNGITRHVAFADINNCILPSSPLVSGSSSVCKNTTESYSATLNLGSTYTWSALGGTITSGNGTSSINVLWGNTGMAGYVRVYESTPCGSTSIIEIPVTIHSLPTTSIDGPSYSPDYSDGNIYSVTNPQIGYTYIWTISGDGSITAGQGTSAITVSWESEGLGTICVTAQKTGCSAAAQLCKSVTIYHVINSIKTGNWTDPLTWDCNCIPSATNNARVMTGHTVSLVGNSEIQHFIVNGTLFDNAKNLVVTGDLNINGTYNGTSGILEHAGIPEINTIYGIGTLSFTTGKFLISDGVKVISSAATLNLTNGNLEIAADLIVTNNGTITIDDNIIGNAGCAWVNAQNSTLNIGNTLLSIGTLNADQTGNTVNYNGAIAQNVKAPQNSYYNLSATGSLTKSLLANTDINGDLYISSTLDVTINNYNITLAGNFTNSGTFTARSASVTMDGTMDQNIDGTTQTSFYDLTISKTSNEVYLGNNETVTRYLTLDQGALDLNANRLNITLSSTDAVSRALGYIISENFSNLSKVRWSIGTSLGSHIIPFGTLSGEYIPFTVNLTAGDIGNLTVSTYNTAADNTPLPLIPIEVKHLQDMGGNDNSANTVDRFWQIDKDGLSGTTDITFTYAEDETPTGGEVNLVGQRYQAAPGFGYWETPIASQISNPGGNSVTVPGVMSFSPWTLSQKSSPLPIELLSFKALAKNNTVEVKWATTNEQNSDYAVIEKSVDGNKYEEIGRKKSINKQGILADYSITDFKPYKGITSYYRLKQIDINGSLKTYPWVPVNLLSENLVPEFKLFPNPSIGPVTVEIINNSEPFNLRIFNSLGRQLFSKCFSEKIEININEFSEKALYLEIRDQNDKLITTKTLIKGSSN